MSATITLQTLPSGKLLATINDGSRSYIDLQSFDTKPWPKESFNRLTQALLMIRPPVQTNANIIKFPRYRHQRKGYEEVPQ
jgi:hypothetical protein